MELFFSYIFPNVDLSELISSHRINKEYPILPDVVNQIWFLLIIFLFYYFNFIKLRLFVFLLVTAFLPFLINGILFPITYMPDQGMYFDLTYSMRNFISVYELGYVYTIMPSESGLSGIAALRPNALQFIGLVFAYFPIPFINSVYSISIINRMLYTVLIILSVHYKIIRGKMILFFLLFPGLVLYSSIGLREMIILTLMLGTAYCLIYHRYFFIIPFLLSLFFIKFQNAVILGVICFFYITFFGNFFGSKFLKTIIFCIAFLLLIYLFYFFQTNIGDFLNQLEELRRYFYAEECRKIKGYWCWDGYEPLDFQKLLITIMPLIFDFAFAPLIWESANIFQLLQSLENIFVNLLFIILLYQLYKYNKIKTIFWLASICVAYGIYGMLIFNFGTLSRYRFPFLVTFIFIIASEINKYRFNKT